MHVIAKKGLRREVVEINQRITRKPVNKEVRSVLIQVVRERIARDWRRGVLTRDLAALYRVSRPEIERIVHDEIVGDPQRAA